MKEERYPLDFCVIVDDEEPAVYIRLIGFESPEDTEAYAEFLSEYLPLMLFESTVIH